MDNNLQDFITGINSRSKKSFEQLFSLFYKELVYFSGLLQNGGEEAEDVVQDVFIQLWESKYTFPDVKSLRGFLYTAVKNKTINKIHRENKLSKDKSLLEVMPDQEKIMSSIIDAEVLSIINYSINKLPAMQHSTKTKSPPNFPTKCTAHFTPNCLPKCSFDEGGISRKFEFRKLKNRFEIYSKINPW